MSAGLGVRAGTLGTRLVVWVLLGGWAVLLLGAAPSAAFWSGASSASGSTSTTLGSVLKARTPTVDVSVNDVTLTWEESQLADGSDVTGYTVQRYNTSNTSQTMRAGCAGTLTTRTCTEVDVPDGLWTYAITPVFRSWTGPQSDRSAQVRSDATAPTISVTRTSTSGNSLLSGTNLFYRGIAAGSFTLTMTVTDAGSSAASASTTALTPAAAGWSHTPSVVLTPVGGPYVSNPFSWTAGTGATVSETVIGYDLTGNSVSRTLAYVDDSAGPTGGAMSHPTGVQASRSLTITTTAVTDSGAGLASRVLQRRNAALTVATNTCGTYGAWATTSTSPAASLTQTLTNNNCYQYQYVLTDNLGNVTTVPGSGTVKIRAYATAIAGTSGILDYYRLGEASGTTFADTSVTTTTNTGTWSGGPTLNVPGALVGDPSTAVTFDGVNDYGVVSRGTTGNTNFSIEFWFKSTGGLGTTSSWTDGAGLVDASVAGTVSDFGVALMQNGRICAGAGNPDVSACTTAGYADDAWHHVVFTRTASTRALVVYVDGVSRASLTTASTAALSASTEIRIGSLATGTNFYAGSLDEVAIYSAALSAATVSSHFQANQP